MNLKRLAARGLSTLLDPTIALSYDRTGYRLHSLQFNPADLDVDLTGRQILITGANGGIGRATAAALVGLGATVWMLCRSEARGEAARQALTAETGGDLRLAIVDLSDQTSIRTFAADFPLTRIDVLIHNAGVLPQAWQETADGLERTLATNLVGPYLLTRLLQDRLAASDDGRLIFVSSGGMYSQKLRVDRLNAPAEGFDGVVAYARTKRAMVVMSEVLSDELPGIGVHCMHPGWASTPGVETSIPRFHKLTAAILRTPEQGADTIVWLAAAEVVKGQSGAFWFDRQPRRTHYSPLTRARDGERDRLMSALKAWI
ncbi:MAG: dehydrogenase/reductase SDR family protein 12 [Myxococcota bacterium]|jgi:dehydrogenase/reductase SDR family protein 12